jgi:RNA polymerase sigma-70 factor (ECF subfamily)
LQVAYRILESPEEAQDVVQDAWLRWQGTDRRDVVNPTAFLVTTTTRLALNLAQSARSRRERYADPATLDHADSVAGPEARAERGEAVEHAVLLLLQQLSPTERACLVLREVFDYPYAQIAQLVRLTPVNTRQLVRRSHAHMTTGRRRAVNAGMHRRLVSAFRAAAETGHVAVLEQAFAADLAG